MSIPFLHFFLFLKNFCTAALNDRLAVRHPQKQLFKKKTGAGRQESKIPRQPSPQHKAVCPSRRQSQDRDDRSCRAHRSCSFHRSSPKRPLEPAGCLGSSGGISQTLLKASAAEAHRFPDRSGLVLTFYSLLRCLCFLFLPTVFFRREN